ncbi:MAG: glycosyltransferase [Candidatus Aminicenantes bacterium]|nr:glycosyltransferase [Candidatus Aminicenantes bacterium]
MLPREETCDDVEPKSPPRKSGLNWPFLRMRINQLIALLLIGSCALILLVMMRLHLFSYWVEFLNSSKYLKFASWPLLISLIGIISAMALQTILWFRYKPETLNGEGKDAAWPAVSVIVAALNEEAYIESSLEAIFAGNYPEDKLEVICVNDGSTDGTAECLGRAKKKYGDRLKVVHFNKNLGKRKALYVGYKLAKGEIIVTIDADSKAGRNAVRNLVVPLIRDERCGAVAGRIAVLNEKANFLTRMLAVRYSISFDFGRAYQSVFGTVVSCSGSLMAVRRSLFGSVMGDFMGQTFRGVPVMHGEDRALTTLVLKAGYEVKYQSSAVVYTTVPTRMGEMNKMYLRWTRSYVRETVFLARFIFSGKRRTRHRILPVIDFVFLNFLPPFHLLAIGVIAYAFVIDPISLLRHSIFIAILAFILSLYYLRTNRSWAFLYGIPYAIIAAFFLWWIVPFSLLTMKNQSWVTR